MSGDDRSVVCDVHGPQPETVVCGHLVQSLATGDPIGFNTEVGSDEERPDAWCNDCEERRIDEGGEWTDTSNEYLKVKVLCALCYDQCRDLNAAGQSRS